MPNPTINNNSGVTPLNDDYSLDVQYIEEVKYQQTEFITNSSKALAQDLQVPNALKRKKINEEIGPPARFVSFEGRLNQSMTDLKEELDELKEDVGELKAGSKTPRCKNDISKRQTLQ